MIVSNNAAEAITTYLSRFDATSLVRGIVGREALRPDLLKPHPSLVLAALELAQAEPPFAVLIGDSVTDVEVAHRAGMRAVGYGKTPGRCVHLDQAGAEAVTRTMILEEIS